MARLIAAVWVVLLELVCMHVQVEAFQFLPPSCLPRQRLTPTHKQRLTQTRWVHNPLRAVVDVRGGVDADMHADAAERRVVEEGVVYYQGNEIVAVEDTLRLWYTPKEGTYLKQHPEIMFVGGFNGWDGTDSPLIVPMQMTSTDSNTWTMSLVVPPFAKKIDFAFTDGVRYDTNDQKYYHIHVTSVREVDDDGNIVLYDHLPDGTLVRTGVVEKSDPQELERLVDEELVKVRGNLKQDTVVKKREEEAVQYARSLAQGVGEALGLGNMEINQARDTFDLFDDAQARMSFGKLAEALDHLGFELDNDELVGLVKEFVLTHRPEASDVSLEEFIHIFARLEQQDNGIKML